MIHFKVNCPSIPYLVTVAEGTRLGRKEEDLVEQCMSVYAMLSISNHICHSLQSHLGILMICIDDIRSCTPTVHDILQGQGDYTTFSSLTIRATRWCGAIHEITVGRRCWREIAAVLHLEFNIGGSTEDTFRNFLYLFKFDS